MSKPPIALLLFSNDLDNYLPMVEQERKAIEEALEHLHDTNRLKVIARSSVSSEEIFRLFNRYQGRIVLFHFAGHADGNGLQLNQTFTDAEMGQSVGLAELFEREVRDGLLRFVFLNGCRTQLQVTQLKTAGVTSIIATHRPIKDNQAVALAKQFYRYLANADLAEPFSQPFPNIKTAFTTAQAFGKTNNFTVANENNGEQQRSVMLRKGSGEKSETWELTTTEPAWTLPDAITSENKAFNEVLIPTLLKTFAPVSKKTRNLIQSLKSKPDWEAAAIHSVNAQNIIVNRYAGVLGNQLARLCSIPKVENKSYEEKQRDYLANCILTAKRALQVLCFSLLAHLWDEKKKREFTLTAAQTSAINNFFESQSEANIATYFQLLTILHQLFREQQLTFPLSELADLSQQLLPDSDFQQTCQKIQELDDKRKKNNARPEDCFKAERYLTTILVTLVFLRKYKLLSISSIAYEGKRHQPPKYMHTLGALRGFENRGVLRTEEVKYLEPPAQSDAILLWKRVGKTTPNSLEMFDGHHIPIVNLFPFIIDWNRLNEEDVSKIYFYSFRQTENGGLCYQFFFDNGIERINYRNRRGQHTDYTDLMNNDEWRRELRLDTVYLQFQKARDTILANISDNRGEGEEDDDDEY